MQKMEKMERVWGGGGLGGIGRGKSNSELLFNQKNLFYGFTWHARLDSLLVFQRKFSR